MTRRRILLIFLLALVDVFSAPRAIAQSQTTVTGNVVDPKGFFYAGGTVKAQLYPPGVASPCVFTGPNCIPIPATTGQTTIDFFGNFLTNVYPNSLIFCGGQACTTQWTFVICITPGVIEPPIGTGDQCFSVTTTIVGASQNITATITAAPPPNLTRIPIGGGGGCTPPGVDTGVLTEHPIGSCFDSLDWVWNDTTKVSAWGDGTNTFPSAQQSFTVGFSNKLDNCLMCWSWGEREDLTAVGILNDEQKMSMGWFNTNKGAGTSEQIGDTNTLSFAGASHCSGCNDDLIQIGFENNMNSLVSTVYVAPSIGHQLGNQNQASMTASGGQLSDFTEVGTANNMADTSTANAGGIVHAFSFGLQNRVKDDLGSSTSFTGNYGFDNEIDGSDPQDPAIYGQSNTVHSLVICSTGSCPPAQDTTIGGNQNTITNVGGGLSWAVHSTLSNCLACGVIGYNESNSVSNSLNIGMGSHEIEITLGAVAMPSLSSAGVALVCATSVGHLQVTGCPTGGTAPVNWEATPGYGGNSAPFAGAANAIQLVAIAGPQVSVSISAVSFAIQTSDNVNNAALGIYGPCAPGTTCTNIVCTTTATTYAAVVAVSKPCSQTTPLTIAPVTTAGQYYYLATTSAAGTVRFNSSNHIVSAVCAASTTTSAGGALPASVAIPAVSWTLCGNAPLVTFHQ